MQPHQTSHWYYVHQYFTLVLALVTLLPIVRSLLFMNANYLQFEHFSEAQSIYLYHDILQTIIWFITFLLLLLTHIFQKKSQKSTLILIYIQNIIFPLLLILYTTQTNHMYYELLENGYYRQMFENFDPQIVYDAESIREKLDYESLIRMIRMGILLLVGGLALTLNSIYFSKRKCLFHA